MSEPVYPPFAPPLDGVSTPRFFEWNTSPDRWELLSARLLDRDPRFRQSDLFERRGLKQYGIDALAEIRDGGNAVLSAKCYEKATAANIAKWSGEFLKHHKDYWSSRDIRVFVLSVAAPNVTGANIMDQIRKEKERFEKLGIAYEVWGPEPVYDRLRPHEDLITRFLGHTWRDMIFGPRPTAGGVVDAALVRQLSAAQDVVADQVGAKLTDAMEQLRCGEREAVVALIGAVTADDVWPLLPAPLQAKALRLSARIAVEDGDLERAGEEAAAAAALDGAEPIVEAKIAQERDGPRAASAVLGSPVSSAGRRYQAGLHLAVGQIDEARRILQTLDPSDDPAENARLWAFLKLAQQDYDGALQSAEAAAADAPLRLPVQLVLAMARYASGLSPSTPTVYALQPNIPPEDLVRQDSESVRRRQLAIEAFRGLAGGRYGAAAQVDDWVLACLCCDPTREDEAKALVAERLAASPVDNPALVAGLARDWPVDLGPALAAFDAKLTDGSATEGEVETFARMSLVPGTPTSVADRLEKALPGLSDDARAQAEGWIARLREPAQEITDPAAQLFAWMSATPPDPQGLQFASQLAGHRRWSDLAPIVDRLALFRTPAAVSLAAYTLHHTASSQAVLSFIDDHAGEFPAGALPLDLRRIRLVALGDVDAAEAIRTSQALIAETNASSDRQHLTGLLLAAGTVQTALPVIRRLLADGAVNAGDAIHYSVATAGEDIALATALWRHGVAEGVPESLLLHAITQGYRLGLDAELGGLMQRMHMRAQSDAGDVWQVSVDDLPGMLLKRRDDVQDVQQKMLDGLIPVHLAPRGLVGSLADLYRFDAETRPGPQPLVLIRHGWRPVELEAPTPWGQWQIVMDPTALLVADQLGLLDHVESLTKPTLISRSLPDVIYGLEQDAPHGQPARVDAARRILAAIGGGTLAVATDAPFDLTVVHERGADEPGHAIAEVEAFLTGGDVGETRLVDGQRLVFTEGTMESLAMTAARLDEVLSRFRCEIARDDLAEANAEIRASDAGATLAARLRTLRERVALGLTRGTFAYLSTESALAEDVESEGDDDDVDPAAGYASQADPATPRRVTPLEACLMGALSSPGGEGRVVWIDDRMTSGYRRSQDNPIVTVVEVLNALVSAGRMTAAERFGALMRLRRGGAAFIPMTADEVMASLRPAPIRGGVLQETPDLAVLRRNLASTGRLDRHLYVSLTGERASEQTFFSTQMRLMEQCLRAVWSEDGVTEEDRVARSDWIWASLKLERCVRPLPVDQPGDGNRLMASISLAGLFALGAQIDGGQYAERLARRQAYIDWLSRCALAPRMGRSNRAWVSRLVEQYRSLYQATFDLKVAPEDMKLVLRLRHDEIMALPDALREPLIADPAFAASVGLTSLTRFSTGEHVFDSQPLWSACARAVRLGQATVKSVDGQSVPLSWTDQRLTVGVSPGIVMNLPFAEALALTGEPRSAAIRAYVQTLDLPAGVRDEVIATAIRSRSKTALVQTLLGAGESVVEHHYGELAEAFAGPGDIPLQALFPPPARAALHALRLDGTGPIGERVRQAWLNLSTSLGDDQALLRLGGLPVDLSDLVPAFTPSFPLSVVAALHLTAARRRAGADDVVSIEAVLAHPDEAHGLLLDLVAWSRKAYASDPDWRALPLEERLALCWAHAHRLQTVLFGLTDEYADIRRRFADYQPSTPKEDQLAGDPAFHRDRAGPALLKPSSLVYHGLAYVLGGAPDWMRLPTPLQGELATRVLAFAPDQIGLDAGLLLASDHSTNALGSWLNRTPEGLLAAELVPGTLRRAYLQAALSEIETGSGALDAWRMASLLARPGCAEAEAERYAAAVAALDFSTLALSQDGMTLCQIAVEGLQAHPLDDDAFFRMMHAIAGGVAKTMTSAVRLDDPRTADVVDPVLMVLIAGSREDDPASTYRRLYLGALACARAWPALAVVFRALFDRWYSQADPGVDDLWAAVVEFRAWP